jgi:peptide deformylase
MGALSVVKIDRNLLTFKDIVLRQQAIEVPIHNSEYLKLCQKLSLDMFEVMYASDGAAIAAPQVGISLRLVAMDPAGLKFGPHVLINPTIESTSQEEEEGDEGCLSLPLLMGTVRRSKEIFVKAYNLKGELEEYHLKGWLARVFQHEIDHLDGILYPDHVREGDLVDVETGTRRRALAAIHKLMEE